MVSTRTTSEHDGARAATLLWETEAQIQRAHDVLPRVVSDHPHLCGDPELLAPIIKNAANITDDIAMVVARATCPPDMEW